MHKDFQNYIEAAFEPVMTKKSVIKGIEKIGFTDASVNQSEFDHGKGKGLCRSLLNC